MSVKAKHGLQWPHVGDCHEQSEDRRGQGEIEGGEAERRESQDGGREGVEDS